MTKLNRTTLTTVGSALLLALTGIGSNCANNKGDGPPRGACKANALEGCLSGQPSDFCGVTYGCASDADCCSKHCLPHPTEGASMKLCQDVSGDGGNGGGGGGTSSGGGSGGGTSSGGGSGGGSSSSSSSSSGAGGGLPCVTIEGCGSLFSPCASVTCENGFCNVDPKANNSFCNDGDECTQGDSCQNGVCVGGSPVVCDMPPDACHLPICVAGACPYPEAPFGDPCDDGNGCTQTDTCEFGACVGSNPLLCPGTDHCYHGACLCGAPYAGEASYPTGSHPLLVAAADFTKDGFVDLAVGDYYDYTVSVLINQGDGTFVKTGAYPIANFATSIAAADFDGDGDADLAVTTPSVNNTVSVLINQGGGMFAPLVDYPTGSYPSLVVAADVSGDSKPDLLTVNISSNNVSVLINQGNGTFVAQAPIAVGNQPNGLVAADWNNDGKLDLAVANSFVNGTVSVFMNQGNAVFQPSPDILVTASSLAAGDINSDGKTDLVVAHNSIGVIPGKGDGTFGTEVGMVANPATTLIVAEMNGDGGLDIATSGGMFGTVNVLLNNGDNTFTTSFTYPASPDSVAAADVNNDGRADLIVPRPDVDMVAVLINACP